MTAETIGTEGIKTPNAASRSISGLMPGANALSLVCQVRCTHRCRTRIPQKLDHFPQSCAAYCAVDQSRIAPNEIPNLKHLLPSTTPNHTLSPAISRPLTAGLGLGLVYSRPARGPSQRALYSTARRSARKCHGRQSSFHFMQSRVAGNAHIIPCSAVRAGGVPHFIPRRGALRATRTFRRLHVLLMQRSFHFISLKPTHAALISCRLSLSPTHAARTRPTRLRACAAWLLRSGG